MFVKYCRLRRRGKGEKNLLNIKTDPFYVTLTEKGKNKTLKISLGKINCALMCWPRRSVSEVAFSSLKLFLSAAAGIRFLQLVNHDLSWR